MTTSIFMDLLHAPQIRGALQILLLPQIDTNIILSTYQKPIHQQWR